MWVLCELLFLINSFQKKKKNFLLFFRRGKLYMMDETPSSLPAAEKSPQIKLTMPTASEPIKNLVSRSLSPSPSSSPLPSPSPTHKRKQLLPSTTMTNDIKEINLQTKCDTSLNVGSATGKFSFQCLPYLFIIFEQF